MPNRSKTDIVERVKLLEEEVYPSGTNTPDTATAGEDGKLDLVNTGEIDIGKLVSALDVSGYDITGVGELESDSLNTDNGQISDLADDTRGQNPGDNHKLESAQPGNVLGENLRSWSMRRPQNAGILPHERSKARISFSWDGMYTSESSLFEEMLEERGIPFTGNLTAGNLGENSTPGTRIDAPTIQKYVASGMEVSSYVRGANGENLDDLTDEEAIEALLWRRRELEDLNFSISQHKARQGRGIEEGETDEVKSYAIRSAYAVSRASGRGTSMNPDEAAGRHWAPTPMRYGMPNYNMETRTQTEMEDFLDRLIEVNGVASMFAHPVQDNFDKTAFRNFLDKVESERAAGNVEVTTDTGLTTLPYDADSVNIIPDPDASASNTYAVSDYFWTGNPDTSDVEVDGTYANTGNNSFRVSPGEVGFGLDGLGIELEYQTAMVEFKARCDTGNTATIEVRNNERGDAWGNGDADLRRLFHDIDDTWTHIFQPIGFPRVPTRSNVFLRVDGGSDVWVDGFKIYPI